MKHQVTSSVEVSSDHVGQEADQQPGERGGRGAGGPHHDPPRPQTPRGPQGRGQGAGDIIHYTYIYLRSVTVVISDSQ